jgi:hypothetical protein
MAKRMGVFATNCYFLKSSASYVFKHKDLLLFPILQLLFLIALITPLSLLTFHGTHDLNWHHYIGFFVVFFLIVVSSYAIFSSALTYCILMRMQHKSTTIAQGIRYALSKFPKLATWFALDVSVGLVLHTLEKGHSVIRDILVFLFSMVWSLLNLYTLPILLLEDKSVIASIKSSGQLLRKTYGRSRGSRLRFFLFAILFVLIFILLPLIIFTYFFTSQQLIPFMQSHILLVSLIALFLILAVSVLSRVFHAVVISALYLHFDKEIDYGHIFNQEMVDSMMLQGKK